MTRHVRLRIRRTGGWADFAVEVQDGAFVLDALEAAWRTDRSLLFRHSCHHGSCGTCGMRINGREALACMTRVAEAARGGRPIRLEPLRNLPLVGDLLVDTQGLSIGLERVGLPMVQPAEGLPGSRRAEAPLTQFVECIECGLCISACPIAGSDDRYVGPAILAAVGSAAGAPEDAVAQAALDQAHDEHGLWRCHAAFECSEVCPSGVDPARRILALRGADMAQRGGGGQA